MAVNFAYENFVKISCDTVCNDYNPVNNLISFNQSKRRDGFLVDHFIKPPVTIIIDFLKYNLDLWFLELGLRLRTHKTKGIEISIANQSSNNNCPNNDDIVIAKIYKDTPDILIVSNEVFKPNSLLSLPEKQFTNPFTISGKYLKYCKNIKSIKIKILSTLNSTVPCLSFLNIFGKPTGLTETNLPEFLSEFNQNDNSPEPVQTATKRKDLSDIEHLAPPDFFDSLTYTLMRMPYKLPSGKNIDKETLDRYVDEKTMYECLDPFTRIKFSNTYKPTFNEELKRRIDEFISTDGQSEIERNELRKKLLKIN